MRRLQKEAITIQEESSSNISASPVNDDLFHWQGFILGPEGSSYEGGIFNLDIQIPANYPFSPPKIKFTTKVYHCNINTEGEICLDIVKQWVPATTIANVLLSISSLLENPNPNDPLVAEIAELLRTDKERHDATAKEWTVKYAT